MQDEGLQRLRFSIAVTLALLLHGAVAFAGFSRLYELEDFARRVQAGMQQRIHASIQVALEPEPPPPPPEEPEPEPEPEPPLKAPPKAPAPKEPARTPEPPAPAAAQAGRVLAAEPDPDEPVDLTAMTIVQGNADAYVGGVTAANGTSARPVRAPTARADGVQGGKGTAPASAVDHSRPARPKEPNWDCPFPPGEERMNYAVNVMVSVSGSGKVLDARAIGNANPGYAREAERCARSNPFDAARDSAGAGVTSTIPIVVRFTLR